MGPNCLMTSRAALALQAGPPQAETRSCLTPTLSSDESHKNSGASSAAAGRLSDAQLMELCISCVFRLTSMQFLMKNHFRMHFACV
jgi:hypothetical protein